MSERVAQVSWDRHATRGVWLARRYLAGR
jgi:hypothetical protein